MPSRNNAAVLSEALERLTTAILAVSAANPVVLIDGRSGAGKTTVARVLAAHWPLTGRAQLVALDMIYPGWDGLEVGVDAALKDILVPHARGAIGVWQRWDWETGKHAESAAVDPALGLIVEGSGILRPDTARRADVCVWVDAPDAVRKKRALDRDGEMYRPHWERWAAQEERHIKRDRPESLATIRIVLP